MSQIKTREKVNGIKVLDKGAVASERMRSAFIRTKQNASALVDHDASSENEYASDSAQNLAENTLHDAGDAAVNGSKAAMRKGRELVEKKINSRADERKGDQDNTEQAAQSSHAHTEPASSQPDVQSQTSTGEKTFEQGRELAKKRTVEKRAEQTRIVEPTTRGQSSPRSVNRSVRICACSTRRFRSPSVPLSAAAAEKASLLTTRTERLLLHMKP